MPYLQVHYVRLAQKVMLSQSKRLLIVINVQLPPLLAVMEAQCAVPADQEPKE